MDKMVWFQQYIFISPPLNSLPLLTIQGGAFQSNQKLIFFICRAGESESLLFSESGFGYEISVS